MTDDPRERLMELDYALSDVIAKYPDLSVIELVGLLASLQSRLFSGGRP